MVNPDGHPCPDCGGYAPRGICQCCTEIRYPIPVDPSLPTEVKPPPLVGPLELARKDMSETAPESVTQMERELKSFCVMEFRTYTFWKNLTDPETQEDRVKIKITESSVWQCKQVQSEDPLATQAVAKLWLKVRAILDNPNPWRKKHEASRSVSE